MSNEVLMNILKDDTVHYINSNIDINLNMAETASLSNVCKYKYLESLLQHEFKNSNSPLFIHRDPNKSSLTFETKSNVDAEACHNSIREQRLCQNIAKYSYQSLEWTKFINDLEGSEDSELDDLIVESLTTINSINFKKLEFSVSSNLQHLLVHRSSLSVEHWKSLLKIQSLLYVYKYQIAICFENVDCSNTPEIDMKEFFKLLLCVLMSIPLLPKSFKAFMKCFSCAIVASLDSTSIDNIASFISVASLLGRPEICQSIEQKFSRVDNALIHLISRMHHFESLLHEAISGIFIDSSQTTKDLFSMEEVIAYCQSDEDVQMWTNSKHFESKLIENIRQLDFVALRGFIIHWVNLLKKVFQFTSDSHGNDVKNTAFGKLIELAVSRLAYKRVETQIINLISFSKVKSPHNNIIQLVPELTFSLPSRSKVPPPPTRHPSQSKVMSNATHLKSAIVSSKQKSTATSLVVFKSSSQIIIQHSLTIQVSKFLEFISSSFDSLSVNLLQTHMGCEVNEFDSLKQLNEELYRLLTNYCHLWSQFEIILPSKEAILEIISSFSKEIASSNVSINSDERDFRTDISKYLWNSNTLLDNDRPSSVTSYILYMSQIKLLIEKLLKYVEQLRHLDQNLCHYLSLLQTPLSIASESSGISSSVNFSGFSGGSENILLGDFSTVNIQIKGRINTIASEWNSKSSPCVVPKNLIQELKKNKFDVYLREFDHSTNIFNTRCLTPSGSEISSEKELVQYLNMLNSLNSTNLSAVEHQKVRNEHMRMNVPIEKHCFLYSYWLVQKQINNTNLTMNLTDVMKDIILKLDDVSLIGINEQSTKLVTAVQLPLSGEFSRNISKIDIESILQNSHHDLFIARPQQVMNSYNSLLSLFECKLIDLTSSIAYFDLLMLKNFVNTESDESDVPVVTRFLNTVLSTDISQRFPHVSIYFKKIIQEMELVSNLCSILTSKMNDRIIFFGNSCQCISANNRKFRSSKFWAAVSTQVCEVCSNFNFRHTIQKNIDSSLNHSSIVSDLCDQLSYFLLFTNESCDTSAMYFYVSFIQSNSVGLNFIQLLNYLAAYSPRYCHLITYVYTSLCICYQQLLEKLASRILSQFHFPDSISINVNADAFALKKKMCNERTYVEYKHIIGLSYRTRSESYKLCYTRKYSRGINKLSRDIRITHSVLSNLPKVYYPVAKVDVSTYPPDIFCDYKDASTSLQLEMKNWSWFDFEIYDEMNKILQFSLSECSCRVEVSSYFIHSYLDLNNLKYKLISLELIEFVDKLLIEVMNWFLNCTNIMYTENQTRLHDALVQYDEIRETNILFDLLPASQKLYGLASVVSDHSVSISDIDEVLCMNDVSLQGSLFNLYNSIRSGDNCVIKSELEIRLKPIFFNFIDDSRIKEVLHNAMKCKYQSNELVQRINLLTFIYQLKLSSNHGFWFSDSKYEMQELYEFIYNECGQDIRKTTGSDVKYAVPNISVTDLIQFYNNLLFNSEKSTNENINMIFRNKNIALVRIDFLLLPQIITSEIQLVERELLNQQIEVKLIEIIKTGKEYLSDLRNISVLMDLDTLDNMLQTALSLKHHCHRNLILYNVVLNIIKLRKSLRCGNWNVVYSLLNEMKLSDNYYTNIPDIVDEIRVITKLWEDNNLMHKRFIDSMNNNQVKGTCWSLDTSNVDIIYLLRSLSITKSTKAPIISKNDDSMVYSVEKLIKVRKYLMMSDYDLLKFELDGIKLESISCHCIDEILLIKSSLDVWNNLNCLYDSLTSGGISGIVGTIDISCKSLSDLNYSLLAIISNASQMHKVEANEIIDKHMSHQNFNYLKNDFISDNVNIPSTFPIKIQYFLSNAIFIEKLRSFVKAGKWNVENISNSLVFFASTLEQEMHQNTSYQSCYVENIDYCNELFTNALSYSKPSSEYSLNTISNSNGNVEVKKFENVDVHQAAKHIRIQHKFAESHPHILNNEFYLKKLSLSSANIDSIINNSVAKDICKNSTFQRNTVFFSKAVTCNSNFNSFTGRTMTNFETSNTATDIGDIADLLLSQVSILADIADEVILVRNELYNRISMFVMLKGLELNEIRFNEYYTDIIINNHNAKVGGHDSSVNFDLSICLRVVEHLGIYNMSIFALKRYLTCLVIQKLRATISHYLSIINSRNGDGVDDSTNSRVMSILFDIFSDIRHLKLHDAFDPIVSTELNRVFKFLINLNFRSSVYSEFSSRFSSVIQTTNIKKTLLELRYCLLRTVRSFQNTHLSLSKPSFNANGNSPIKSLYYMSSLISNSFNEVSLNITGNYIHLTQHSLHLLRFCIVSIDFLDIVSRLIYSRPADTSTGNTSPYSNKLMNNSVRRSQRHISFLDNDKSLFIDSQTDTSISIFITDELVQLFQSFIAVWNDLKHLEQYQCHRNSQLLDEKFNFQYQNGVGCLADFVKFCVKLPFSPDYQLSSKSNADLFMSQLSGLYASIMLEQDRDDDNTVSADECYIDEYINKCIVEYNSVKLKQNDEASIIEMHRSVDESKIESPKISFNSDTVIFVQDDVTKRVVAQKTDESTKSVLNNSYIAAYILQINQLSESLEFFLSEEKETCYVSAESFESIMEIINSCNDLISSTSFDQSKQPDETTISQDKSAFVNLSMINIQFSDIQAYHHLITTLVSTAFLSQAYFEPLTSEGTCDESTSISHNSKSSKSIISTTLTQASKLNVKSFNNSTTFTNSIKVRQGFKDNILESPDVQGVITDSAEYVQGSQHSPNALLRFPGDVKYAFITTYRVKNISIIEYLRCIYEFTLKLRYFINEDESNIEVNSTHALSKSTSECKSNKRIVKFKKIKNVPMHTVNLKDQIRDSADSIDNDFRKLSYSSITSGLRDPMIYVITGEFLSKIMDLLSLRKLSTEPDEVSSLSILKNDIATGYTSSLSTTKSNSNLYRDELAAPASDSIVKSKLFEFCYRKFVYDC